MRKILCLIEVYYRCEIDIMVEKCLIPVSQ